MLVCEYESCIWICPGSISFPIYLLAVRYNAHIPGGATYYRITNTTFYTIFYHL